MASQTFPSFGRCASGQSLVEAPTDLDEVQKVFRKAASEQRRVTIRGGGHSFDGQAVQEGDVGSNIVLTTDAFKDIRFRADASGHSRRRRQMVRHSDAVTVAGPDPCDHSNRQRGDRRWHVRPVTVYLGSQERSARRVLGSSPLRWCLQSVSR